MEKKRRFSLTGFLAIMFSSLTMELLRHGGYLAGIHVMLRIALAGALAGVFLLAAKYARKISPQK